ncbi:ubiquitin--protein ligase [Tautonia sociabilis]|uniref:Ubiquitin--protein ligase n=1 Tax=Tautonia sociabilis TaxID=2080755 RepID=A0A432MPB5_9BACT|nr:ubiquitin--protein ligase [Tautonia sociabilis]
MERLRDESTIFRFGAQGDPPQRYLIEFHGRSLARERGKVIEWQTHQVEVKLGASYPRTMPELRWLSPIFHPNISEIGLVCLGGYNTHWVPSLQLDELCEMLWDMARFHNYDLRSPYNREAALWAASQATFAFPMDDRPLRDLRAAKGREAVVSRPESFNRRSGISEPASLSAPSFLSEEEPIFILDTDLIGPSQQERARRSEPPSRREPPPEVMFLD